MNVPTTQDLFNFPCEFPIKAVGKDDNDFQKLVVDLIKNHIKNIHPKQITSKSSSSGQYLSVTTRILATSKPQLDAIYTDLNNHKLVLYTL
jgi:putative lipoic acid-binding regulatory protein